MCPAQRRQRCNTRNQPRPFRGNREGPRTGRWPLLCASIGRRLESVQGSKTPKEQELLKWHSNHRSLSPLKDPLLPRAGEAASRRRATQAGGGLQTKGGWHAKSRQIQLPGRRLASQQQNLRRGSQAESRTLRIADTPQERVTQGGLLASLCASCLRAGHKGPKKQPFWPGQRPPTKEPKCSVWHAAVKLPSGGRSPFYPSGSGTDVHAKDQHSRRSGQAHMAKTC